MMWNCTPTGNITCKDDNGWDSLLESWVHIDLYILFSRVHSHESIQTSSSHWAHTGGMHAMWGNVIYNAHLMTWQRTTRMYGLQGHSFAVPVLLQICNHLSKGSSENPKRWSRFDPTDRELVHSFQAVLLTRLRWVALTGNYESQWRSAWLHQYLDEWPAELVWHSDAIITVTARYRGWLPHESHVAH